MKKIMVLGLMLLLAGASVFGQDTEPDPAILEAKKATVVVYDLGRFFGYVFTMVEEDKNLSLSQEQLVEFQKVMVEIKGTERIEPDWAAESLERLELDVLTVDQLIAVDQLAIAREESRETDTSEPKGSGGTGTGPLQTYVAGGAFNPIVDETKSLGEGFASLFSYVEDALK